MAEIYQELINFKNDVKDNIGDMNSMCSTLSEKIASLSTETTSAKASLDGSYQSVNKSTVLSNMEKMIKVLSDLEATVKSDLKGMIDKADNLVSLIGELEELKAKIDSENARANNMSLSEEERNSARSAANTDNGDFNKKHENAMDALNAMKGMGADFSFTIAYTPTSDPDPSEIVSTSFELKPTFVASNGIELDYYLYVPEYGREVTNLAQFNYMHGGGSNRGLKNEDAIRYGLGNALATGKYKPGCVVCIPVVREFNKAGYQALHELYMYVAKEYNTDPERQSIGGHSYGGIAASEIVNTHPGVYSGCVTLSGFDENVTQAFQNTPTLLITGKGENVSGNTGTYHSNKVAEEIKKMGGKANSTTIPGGHEKTNSDGFFTKVMTPDGEEEYPLDWVTKQKLSDNYNA